MMTAGEMKFAGVGARGAASAVEVQASAEPPRRNRESRDKPAQWIALQPGGKLFSPTGSLVWIIGLLGGVACIAPWIARGWLLFVLIVTTVALLVSFDALALWLAREECAPVLLPPGKGLRGREGQTIKLPLALTGSGRRRLPFWGLVLGLQKLRNVTAGILKGDELTTGAARCPFRVLAA